ncbi:MAG TPA: tripartite tricarboxylate transporter substrate binding protein [Burkholderiales bacterium]|nr:tripartite tricarboxylate transporter substrate binding protein [Burkholderiales bacterium]
MTRICRLIGFALAVTGALSAFAADTYPNRPVRLIVPYPAGGPNDVLARMVGGKLNDAWKEQVVIDNRPGAGGNLAVEVAARAAPDGYTIILPAMAYAVNPYLYSKVPYTFEQFTPVTIVAKGPLVLVVTPNSGIGSVKELLAIAKAKPGRLQYASGGTGSSLHLAGELFKYMAGVDILHVPYKGTNDFIPDLLSGRVPISFASPLIMTGHVKAGRLRALGVTSSKRVAGWDVPTIAEAGVKGYESDAWYAILTPAGTPQPIVAQLNKTIAQALRAGDVQEKLGSLGMQAVGNSPQEAAKFIAAEAAKWSKVAKAANIRAD